MEFKQGTLESLVMDFRFWKNKRVLLTGHTGFKGSWLSLWLQKLGTNLTGFSNDIPTKPSLFDIAHVGEGMNSIFGDVRDFDVLKKVMEESKPEIVIHMAAQAILRKSYRDPTDTYSTNVMGTVNILNAIRYSNSVRVSLIVTSDKCYEMKDEIKSYKEDYPMGGYDPYSNSKGCAELVTSSFRNSFFNKSNFEKHHVAIASARAGNVIGGGDWGEDRLVPDIMKGIINNENIIIRNPNSIRPWQFVLDPLNGYLLLIQKLWENGPEFSEAWNFGPMNVEEQNVEWILNKINEYWNGKFKWNLDKEVNPHEESYLKLDSSKAKEKLGWIPKIDLEISIKWILEWYKKFLENENMRDVTIKQIDDFSAIKI